MSITAAAPPTARSRKWRARQMLNKVPEVTLYFWIIKVLCTTVGETAADTLNEKVGLGLTNTTYVMGALLIATLVAQFRSNRYVPAIYWLAVVLLSIVGTLITDNMAEHGITLMTTNIAFSAALLLTFGVWYAFERTLSVHTIVTTRREVFYWLVILFTFALGTSTGDYTSEKLELGYLGALGIFAGAIAVVAVLHFGLKLNAILSFWVAYVLTRPLGASIGDYLSQPTEIGGLGLGVYITSAIFLTAIFAVIVYLTRTKSDVLTAPGAAAVDGASPSTLIVLNKVEVGAELLSTVTDRVAAGARRFFLLVPNPHEGGFDRVSGDVGDGDALLDRALAQLRGVAGAEVDGRVAKSPNAYDDVVEELGSGAHSEVILETSPHHLSEALHIDLGHRVRELGYPLTTVAPATA